MYASRGAYEPCHVLMYNLDFITGRYLVFFLLSKLLTWFMNPLLLLFVGLLAILGLYRRRYTRWGLAFVLLFFYSISIPLTIQPLVRWLEGRCSDPEAMHQHYDVAIVLTGLMDLRRSKPGHLKFTSQVERILEGINLVKRGIADKLLIVGGNADPFNQHVSEARLLRTFALDFGLHEEQVLTEEVSRNTHENAVNTGKILQAGNYRQLVLITSAFHMYRAMAAFHKQQLFPEPYPVNCHSSRGRTHLFDFVPSLGALSMTALVVHEMIGVMIYRLQGYI